MKNRGIIKRIVIGKPREKDFTEADLPSTRLKLFGHVMRTRFGIIFRINLLAALFFVPYALWELLASGYVAELISGFTVQEHFSHLLYLTLLQYGTEIPMLMLGAVGIAGAMYVVRRICWGQSVKILPDFGKGIKQSWLQFMILGLLCGIVNALARYIVTFAALTMESGNTVLWSVAVVAAVLFVIVWAIAMMFAFCQSSLYTVSTGRLLLNSFIFTFKRLFCSLFVCVLSLLPILVFTFMPWAFVRIIGYCLAAVFSIGFAVTVQTVYCHGVFDVFINEKDYPDFVGMGMRGSAADSDEDGESESDDEAESAEPDSAPPQNDELQTDTAQTAQGGEQ